MNKKHLERLISVLLIVFAAFGGAALASVLPDRTDIMTDRMAYTSVPDADEASASLSAGGKKESVLLLIGINDTTGSADLLMLVRVDPGDKKIRALQIPSEKAADFVSICEREGLKSACRTIRNSISELTGIAIDAYLSLDTEGFAKAVDAIGGISPDFPFSFSADGRTYPTGKYDLDGRTAAKLMCADPESEDDFDALYLQQILLRETLGKIRKEFSIVRAASLAGSVYPHVGTDLRFSEILSLIRTGMGMDREDVIIERFS